MGSIFEGIDEASPQLKRYSSIKKSFLVNGVLDFYQYKGFDILAIILSVDVKVKGFFQPAHNVAVISAGYENSDDIGRTLDNFI